MRRLPVLLVSLVVALGVLFEGTDARAQGLGQPAPAPPRACFTWNRTVCSFDPTLETCVPDDLVPQTYVLVITPAELVGGQFVKYVGRHDGACGVNTSRPMEGTAWLRPTGKLDMGFVTYGATTASGSGGQTNCGLIQARAVVDANTLVGAIKWMEVTTNSGTHVQPDTVSSPINGVQIVPIPCPAFTPTN